MERLAGGGASRGSRFVSDPLHFTGVELAATGSSAVARRRAYGDGNEEEESSVTESSEEEEDTVSEPGEAELAVLETAMARIRRAQAKDKAEVKLSRGELAALERHREREMQAERRLRRRAEREDRVPVPIAHLESASSSRRVSKLLPTPGNSGDDDDHGPQRIPGSFQFDDHKSSYPPLDYFTPPGALPTRALTMSSSQPSLSGDNPGRQRGDSPFTYSYVRGSPAGAESSTRHVSDPASFATSHVDPFQFMTTGPRAPQYMSGAAAVPRGSAGASAAVRGRPVRDAKSGVGDDEDDDSESSTASQDEEEIDESDGGRYHGRGSRQPLRGMTHNTRSRAKQAVAEPARSSRRRQSTIVVEAHTSSDEAPERGHGTTTGRSRTSKGKKPSSSSSVANTTKRKSAGGRNTSPSALGSRRRKGK